MKLTEAERAILINQLEILSLTQIPWNLLPATLAALRRPVGEFAKRLRCKHCGGRVARENVTPWAQFLASGAGSRKVRNAPEIPQ